MFCNLLLKITGFNLRGESFVAQICQQLGRLRVQTSIEDVEEQRCLFQVLQVDVVYVANVGQTMVLRVFHVKYTVYHFSFRHCSETKKRNKVVNVIC